MPLDTLKGIRENLRFMLLEVVEQVKDARRALGDPSRARIEACEERDDYIDNLRHVIDNKCFALMIETPELDKPTANLIQALGIINGNLEHMADLAANVVRQTRHLGDPEFIADHEYGGFFDEILAALELVDQAVFSRDVTRALEICRAEFHTDELCERNMARIIEELHGEDHTADLVTYLLIVRYLERIGDSLLNVGEAVISSAVGEKLRIYHYRALEQALNGDAEEERRASFLMSSVGETKSGCRIGRVTDRRDDGERTAIFKEGRLRKILEEKRAIEHWWELFPGLAPRIYGYESHGRYGSLLIENLPGRTLQALALTGSREELHEGLARLRGLLDRVWSSTLRREPVRTGFMQQLQRRGDAVRRAHPEFFGDSERICELDNPPVEEQISAAAEIEESLAAPFSVLIHGDFNLDNVLYDARLDALHFIDLHRSRQFDYVQDVSVFVVSNFRLPVFAAALRRRLEGAMASLLEFAVEFAHRHDDDTFPARLTLGLVRNLITSTRFTLDKPLARAMYLRARYLLQKFLDHRGRPWDEFALPAETLVYES